MPPLFLVSVCTVHKHADDQNILPGERERGGRDGREVGKEGKKEKGREGGREVGGMGGR